MDLKDRLRRGARLDERFQYKDHWRFSDLGKCKRYQVMKRAGVPQSPVSDSTLFIFKMGHLIEKQVLDWLEFARVDILAKQVKVEASQFNAYGSADALIRIDNELSILEIKSTRNAALEYRIPYFNHVLQASAYAHYLGLNSAFLLYIGRDGAVAEAKVNANEVVASIETEWRTLNEYWYDRPQYSGNSYPVLEPWLPLRKAFTEVEYKRAGPWGPKGTKKIELDPECSRCPYKYLCWSGNESGTETKEVGKGIISETKTTPSSA